MNEVLGENGPKALFYLNEKLALKGPKVLYHRLFIKQVSNFTQNARLLPQNGKVIVAVSGGIDSIALLWASFILKQQGLIKELEVAHVNHQTRAKENEEEYLLVKKYCAWMKLPLHYRKIPAGELSLDVGNFELKAREKRQQFFNQLVGANDILWTAHHIDDSFEWWLMQSMKSSTLKSSLGIPVRQGIYRRPFLSVTKRQITRWAEFLELKFYADSSGLNERFERNFLRQKVIPKLAARYPRYLYHYVKKANALARNWGTWELYQGTSKKHQLVIDKAGALLFDLTERGEFYYAEDLAKKALHSLSTEGRGKLDQQLQKLMGLGKEGKMGPLIFSGGVECYSFGNYWWFVNATGRERLAQLLISLSEKEGSLEETILPTFEHYQKRQLKKARALPYLALISKQTAKSDYWRDAPFRFTHPKWRLVILKANKKALNSATLGKGIFISDFL